MFGERFTELAPTLNDETKKAVRILDESGGLETDYMIVDIGKRFISQRLAVNTKYAFWEYKGNPDEILIIFSSEGNEYLMNADKLGKYVCDGNRVFTGNRIAGYHIRPLESGKGCKVTYLALSDK